MTPWRSSCPVEGLSWLAALAGQGADCLVTPAMPGVTPSALAGLWPCREWRWPGPTAADVADGGAQALASLKKFCFGTPGTAIGHLAYHAGFAPLGLNLPAPPTPAGVFRKYRAYLGLDPSGSAVHVHAEDPADARLAMRLLTAARVGDPREEPGKGFAPPRLPAFHGPVSASLDGRAYASAVRAARERILDGDAYQLTLSIRFETPLAPDLSSHDLFLALLARHPAMFYALLHDSSYDLVSTSPERFLRVRGGEVLSQPIKGTRRCHGDPAGQTEALRASAKEDAELSMIVDLIRNDIGHRCAYGSVGVEGHKSVFEVDGLLQMYANVTGSLRQGSDCLDLLWEALPPGSVTGCPKKSAVEIIAGLEPHHRQAYCGKVVAVHGPQDMDSSVAIRTACLDRAAGSLAFFAGSGIVVDSVPELEYEETLAKAAKFLDMVGRR